MENAEEVIFVYGKTKAGVSRSIQEQKGFLHPISHGDYLSTMKIVMMTISSMLKFQTIQMMTISSMFKFQTIQTMNKAMKSYLLYWPKYQNLRNTKVQVRNLFTAIIQLVQ